ncbi:MAG: DNA polymerase I [Patescibacteria group bacterium]|nr:DNA polymerase I [Patescibacteria group bacterium]
MNKIKKDKLIVIDGNALIHRSFHALPPTLRTRDGEQVNAVYGFTSFLLKALKDFKPTYVILTLDRKAKTFRHEAYAEYKATRVKAPDELYAQIPLVKKVAQAFAIPIYELDGYEADDLIGTIANQVDDKVDTIIVTGDQDTMQLINESTFVYTMSRGLTDSVLFDEAAVKAKYGFKPKQMIDYKGLRGDPSDNIPGVKGIGEKTATELLAEFDSIENLYQQLDSDKIKPRIRELLTTYKDKAFLSKELATIDCAVPIKFSLAEAIFGKYQVEKVLELFSEFEFKSLLNKFKDVLKEYGGELADVADSKMARNKRDFNYQLVDSEADFEKFYKKIKQAKVFAFDTETTGLDNFNAKILGASFALADGEAYFLNLREAKSEVNLFNFSDSTKLTPQWLEKLRPIFEDKKIKKIGHNLKFDLKILGALGIDVKGADFDTMIASYLLHPDNRQHNLDALAFTELNFVKINKDELTGDKKKDKDFSAVSVEKLSNYACEDADMTWRLHEKLAKELAEEKLTKLFDELEMPLVTVLARVENAGIVLDTEYLAKLDKIIDQDLKGLVEKIYQLAGKSFNIASVQQLRKVLFEDLQIATEGLMKTKTGLSTGAAELEKLKGKHKIIDYILDWRELNKLSTTYVKSLPELINSATGRVHTNYNQTVAATGRLSSSNPNLQNIPMKTELGKKIRRAFVADKGKVLLSLDYSQIELRLAAIMSNDPGLVKAFKNNLDIHTATAAAINGVKLEEVTKTMRRAAKAINFGLLYGQGAHGLAEGANISYAQAKHFIDEYFRQFAGVKEYIEKCINQAREYGYVETLFGRRRYLPDINSNLSSVRRAAERMAVNTPLQGTAADMIKKAMIEVDAFLQTGYNDKVKMILQVHDELVFELSEKLVPEVTKQIKQIMENVIEADVPILVEAKVGPNWEEMKMI